MFQDISQLLQAVAKELQEPDHVLMPYEHSNAVQGATGTLLVVGISFINEVPKQAEAAYPQSTRS